MWQCWRKGQRFPSEQGDNILHCTALSKMSGCQSVPTSQGSTASRLEGPSWGGCSVLFQCIFPPFSPNTFQCLMWWDSPRLVVLSLWGRLSPSCSAVCCLQMNHDLLTMWVVLQGPKNRTDKGCDPVLAQPADRAGVAPHPGEDVQVFHFAELSDRSCSSVTFVVGSLGSPLATRWEVSTSLLKTRGVHGVEL